jgi:hypothetical protein
MNKTRRPFFTALTLVLAPGFASAAPILGLHEARVLVEHTPIFLEAVRRGECPNTSDSAVGPAKAPVIVRHECKGFGLIADFTVDLSTGAVTQVPGGRIETSQLSQLRARLFVLAESEQISPSEALCLVRQIAPAQAASSCASVRIDRATNDFFYATLDVPCRGEGSKQIRVMVNRHSGELRNEDTTEIYTSPEIERRRAVLMRSHSPATLTMDDAKSLVEAPMAVDELVRRGLLPNTRCTVVELDPSNNADEEWFQIWVGCGASDESKNLVRISVNLIDGGAHVIGSNRTMTLRSVVGLGKAALAKARSRKAASVETIGKECSSQQ